MNPRGPDPASRAHGSLGDSRASLPRLRHGLEESLPVLRRRASARRLGNYIEGFVGHQVLVAENLNCVCARVHACIYA